MKLVKLLLCTVALVPCTLSSPASFQISFNEDSVSPFSIASSNSRGSIVKELQRDGRFSNLLKAISKFNLDDDLNRNEISVFAPTDEAFNMMDMSSSEKDFSQIIAYHMLTKSYSMRDLHKMRTVSTALKLRDLDDHNQRLRLMQFDERIFVQRAMVTGEIDAKNGNIFVIDRLLCPPMTISDHIFMFAPWVFSTTYAAFAHSKMLDEIHDLKGATIFAPTNHAWKSVCPEFLIHMFLPENRDDLKSLLRAHIVPSLHYMTLDSGSEKSYETLNKDVKLEVKFVHQARRPTILINNMSHVVFADGPAENGVVHAISYPIIPRKMHEKLSICGGNLGRSSVMDLID